MLLIKVIIASLVLRKIDGFFFVLFMWCLCLCDIFFFFSFFFFLFHFFLFSLFTKVWIWIDDEELKSNLNDSVWRCDSPINMYQWFIILICFLFAAWLHLNMRRSLSYVRMFLLEAWSWFLKVFSLKIFQSLVNFTKISLKQ
jgi:hypothetical protein